MIDGKAGFELKTLEGDRTSDDWTERTYLIADDSNILTGAIVRSENRGTDPFFAEVVRTRTPVTIQMTEKSDRAGNSRARGTIIG